MIMYMKSSLSILICGLCFILACTSKKSSEEYITGGFKGNIHWSPDTVSTVPEDAPFEISLELEQVSDSNNKSLNMKLILQNTSDDSLYLGAGAGQDIYYDFVVTRLDSMRVWNRLRYNIRGLTLATIKLETGEKKYFEDSWDYENYDGEELEKGKYLLYGFIESLDIWDKNYQEVIKEYDNVGVRADTLDNE